MRIPGSLVRFLLEAAFLVIVAAITGVARLPWYGIIVVMAVAWLLVALVERTASHDASAIRLSRLGRLFASAAPEAAEAASAAPPSHVNVLTPPDGEPDASAPADTAQALTEAEPQDDESSRPEPEPEPVAAAVVEPVEAPPKPVQADSPPPTTPAEPPPAPVAGPRPEPPSPAEPALPELPPSLPVAEVVPLAPRGDGPREWNVWDLERIAREREGDDAVRDEERALLLVQLRQFATPDGLLPLSFDPVVRESFGDLLVPLPR